MTSAQEESARRYPPDRGEVRLSAGSMRNARREAFENGAAWQAEQPVEITDEMVDAAILAQWGDDSWEEWHGQAKQEERVRMRAALEAALATLHTIRGTEDA